MILSTCESYIPVELDEDPDVFPERPSEIGAMYVEAEDKQTLKTIGEVAFTRVSNVLGIIYNSKSGNTKLKWRSLKKDTGKVTGEASLNSIVNLLPYFWRYLFLHVLTPFLFLKDIIIKLNS